MGRIAVPTHRLSPVIRPYLEAVTDGRNETDDAGGYTILGELTGISVRTLRAIVRGDRQTCFLETADALLCAIGRPDLWHLPPEDGGLADVYFADLDTVAA